MLNYLITHTYSMDTNQCHADLQVVPIFQNIDILGTEVFIFHVTDVAVMVMILASKLLFSEIMRLSAMSFPMHSSYTMRDKHWQHKSSVESRQIKRGIRTNINPAGRTLAEHVRHGIKEN